LPFLRWVWITEKAGKTIKFYAKELFMSRFQFKWQWQVFFMDIRVYCGATQLLEE